MATPQELAAIPVYTRLMEEAKERAFSINALVGDQRGLSTRFVREYGYLQLRMLCEIIGLSCLVAHGDLVGKGPKALRKAYAPGEIIKALESLHPDFYPVPMIPQKTPDGWHMAEYDDRPYLTKIELPVLWGLCGDVLHRGSLKSLGRPEQHPEVAFRDVTEWGQKILNLLSNHRIKSASGLQALIAFLQVDDLGGAVQVAIGEAR